jgi:putative oxidoreductase
MNRTLKLFSDVNGLAERYGKALRWLSPTVARLTVGLVFFQSGWGKLHDLGQVTEFFTSLGLPAPAFQALLASSAEFVCGGMLLAGFATRLAVVPLIITMGVAIRTALWEQVEGVSTLVGLLEFAYIALLLWLGTHGPGPLSVDWLIARAARRSAPLSVPAGAPSRAAAEDEALRYTT